MARRLQRLLSGHWSSAVLYVAFKDDITALWDKPSPQDRGVSATEENRLARPGHQQGKAELVLSCRPGHADVRLPLRMVHGAGAADNSVADFQQGRRLQRDRLSRPLWLHSGHHHPGQEGASDRLRKGRSDAGPLGRAVEEPAHQGDHERSRPDLRRLSYRTLYLQGHRRRHRRRAGAHQSVHDEAGHGRLPAADALYPNPIQPVRREYPGTGFHGRRPRGAEGPAQPGPEAIRRSQGAGKARRFAERPRRLRTAGRAQPDRQPGVFNRPEEAGKLRRLLRAGALSPDLEHAVVRLGAV